MRGIVIGLMLGSLLVSAQTNAAGVATSSYITARNKAVVEIQLALKREPETVDERQRAALEQLQGIVEQIVGPIHIEGFPSSGTINLQTLVEDLGYGNLDGIAVKSFDGKEQAVVSTFLLLRNWLRDNPYTSTHSPMAATADIAGMSTTEDFYTGVFGDDAHYYVYAELPVTSGRAMTHVHAVLYAASQDYPAPEPPDGIAVTAVIGDQVIALKTRVTAPDISGCVSAFKQEYEVAQGSYADYQASKLQDKAAIDRYFNLEERSVSDYLQCYGQHLPEQVAYAALVREAQALVDKLK